MSENFNKDELEAPGWMNKSFFEEVLKKCENTDSVSVTDINMSPATAKGDHYASIMFRGKITYNSNLGKGLTKSLIIKAMPQVEGHKMDMLQESYIFETEIAMYSETIPKLEAELRKIGDNTVLGGKALYHSLKPHKCIIFEDICPLGYETSAKRSIDLADSKAAFLKLAKWHAVSYKLAAEGDKSVTDYKHGLFTIKDFDKDEFITGGIKEFTAKCEKVDELKQYVPKLQLIQKDLISRCCKSYDSYRQANPEGIFVLCHGDFHAKNMMFKKNSKGETEDLMLIDFQICFFGPAILDIISGLYMVANEDCRKNHYDELVHYYCSNFIETLEKLNFQGKIPKISEFFMEILRNRHWELFVISTFLPALYALDKGSMDLEELMTSGEFRKTLYDNEDYINDMKRLLPIMFHRGYLEVKEVKISPASAQGDHYASVMFRGAVTYDTPKSKGISKSLIIKTMPELEGTKKDMLGESYIFETEIAMYSETIPKLEAELRKIGDQTVLQAGVLYHSLEPRKVIIFEDICPKGYQVLRDRHCNMDEVKLAFLKLAKWHAVSYKLAAEGDTSVTGYKESFLAFKDIEEMPFMTQGIENFINKINTIDDLKQYVPKLRAIQKDVLKRSINSTKIAQQKGSEGVFVLCHGDFHRKNMMFKHFSDGKIEDVMLIDFQVSYYGPAVLDVLYGMYMLVDENMRLNCYDEIIHYYKLFLMSSFLPMWIAFATGDLNPDDIMTSDEARKNVYESEEYINEIKKKYLTQNLIQMGDFNQDELNAPNWMNTEFFTEVLNKSEEDDGVSINDLKITPGSGKGDHYASVMFRATVNFDTIKSKNQSKSMIVKIAPEADGRKKDLLSKTFVFETEIGMYSETIPKFEEELRKVGDETVLGAKALYYSLEPRKCIIFEDIVPKGYETLRDRGLNMEEVKATLTKLAKWHAVSYKLAAEGDKSVTKYEHGPFSAAETMPFMTGGVENLIEKLKTLDEFQQYVPKLEEIKDDILKRCIQSSNSYRNDENPESIFVLCHGDFHGKNVMFKRNEEGKLEDIMLIDFQACYFGPAVMDLLYGMYLIVDNDMRANNFDEIIHHYCTIFIDTLKKLKFEGKIPQIFEFFIDILRHGHMELFMLSTFLPMWFYIEVEFDLEALLFSNDVRKKLLDAPGYINELRNYLPKMFNRGYFE
ncbi:uncharacterized protein LOC129917984 [Episyrphus balteatus]|uniref:uncharacterized protein LOC129917984 n=1 Tax=Episyrphus balteatus TaxID=286459 RepID=UPI002485F4E7|nr:uncharacterized protein LOC129917984 [Episyrphus balteatus]